VGWKKRPEGLGLCCRFAAVSIKNTNRISKALSVFNGCGIPGAIVHQIT
jgi:hypothetical protein